MCPPTAELGAHDRLCLATSCGTRSYGRTRECPRVRESIFVDQRREGIATGFILGSDERPAPGMVRVIETRELLSPNMFRP